MVVDVGSSSVKAVEGSFSGFQQVVVKLMKSILKKLKIVLRIKKAERSRTGVSGSGVTGVIAGDGIVELNKRGL